MWPLPGRFKTTVFKVSPLSMKLILLTGLPGTGKSTLAERLGQETQVPVFAKDIIESALRRCDVTSVRNGDQPVSYAVYEILFALVYEYWQQRLCLFLEKDAADGKPVFLQIGGRRYGSLHAHLFQHQGRQRVLRYRATLWYHWLAAQKSVPMSCDVCVS